MNKEAQKTSITQKLKNISKKKNVFFPVVVTEFLIERLLARIVADSKLNNSLIFKGGYVGMKVYDSPRYTIDLDALLSKADLRGTLDKVKEAASIDLNDSTWFAFEEELNLQTQGEYGGVRLTFRAGIGEVFKDIRKGQIINFDLGIGDPVTPGPSKQETKELIGNSLLSWQVYPIETIVAEKLHALITRGSDSSRSKDIYDLCHYLPVVDSALLDDAIKACFHFRETEIPNNFIDFISSIDVTILKMGWPNATSTIKDAPSFDEAFELMIVILGDTLKK